MNRTNDEVKTGFICGVDWTEELNHPDMIGPACSIFNSLWELVDKRKCTEECGAVEIEIRVKRWAIEPVPFSQRTAALPRSN